MYRIHDVVWWTLILKAVTFTYLVYFMNENTLSRDYYGMRRYVM